MILIFIEFYLNTLNRLRNDNYDVHTQNIPNIIFNDFAGIYTLNH